MTKRTNPRLPLVVVVVGGGGVVVVVACALYALHWVTNSYRPASGFSPSSHASLQALDTNTPFGDTFGDDDDEPLVVNEKARPFELAQDHFVTLESGVFESRVHSSVANSSRLYFDVRFFFANTHIMCSRAHSRE